MMQKIKTRLRQFASTLLKERLSPGRAAAAVFLGIFIGIVPIYGFQLLAAIGLAILFKLNKPLVVAGTFINNPFLQPFLIVSSVEAGFFLRHGSFRAFTLSSLIGVHSLHSFTLASLNNPQLKDALLSWFFGSVVVGAIVGSIGAVITALIVRLRVPVNQELRDRIRFVKSNFVASDLSDRSFVQWKFRLDRIFSMLTPEDLGSGTVVDLGCGYGMALSFAAFGESGRRLLGCDLNAHRIAVAQKALGSLNAELSVADIRHFGLPSEAGLILIMDVLQYLPAEDQQALLNRCCAALDSEGRLIFRAHDRERGLWSRITLACDRVIFFYERTGTRPSILSTVQYKNILENAGMQVETRRFRNRLPLAHVLFIARKPMAETAL